MSDEAALSAESTAAPETAVDTPNPISTEPEGHPEPEKPEKPVEKPEKAEARPITTREAIQKARETVEKQAKAEAKTEKPVETKPEVKTEAKAEAKPDVKSEPKRDETGKFAAKEPKEQPKPSFTASEAPARFSADAKARWAETHESVRGETERAIRELTEGFNKYRTAAERDNALAEFHDMAQRAGKNLPDVVRDYVKMENLLSRDLVGGLNEICSRLGTSLREVAAHILNQPQDQTANQSAAEIRELKNTIAALQQQIGTVTQTVHQQRESATLQEVTKFAQDHPRFDELSKDIAFFLESKRAADLSEAYELAERLNPAPAKASPQLPAASSAPVIDLAAQTAKGQKSIQGSPSAGSDPATQRTPSPSIKEALRRAVAQAS